jgi:hypothetical protein
MGWLARTHSPAATPAEDGPSGKRQVGKEDEAEFWRYPGARQFGGVQAGPAHLTVYSTADGLDKVAAWYTERVGQTIEPDKATGPGGGGEQPGVVSASCNDSFGPDIGPNGRYPPRAVKIGVGVRTSPASTVTVAINRLEGESQTHIVVSFAQR